jgi:class 3 adenylate cyclase/tetratricopeptide (TPR) repeat protein
MKCPNCQTENREGAKFCSECGESLVASCPQCGKVAGLASKYCDQCGYKFEKVTKPPKAEPESESERKHVTVLFSDLCGYTSLSEKLDPEEVKEITSQLFSHISDVIGKYEGVIEKFIGDAVVALFGAQVAHEDDPVRAIRAAREIHGLIDAKGPGLEKRIGQPLAMHTGINTGLVVTGRVDLEKGIHGVAGDAINLASRLQELANPGEILVGYETYQQAERFFDFEQLTPAKLKGKAESVQVFKVLTAKEQPIRMHRISGLRAELIGRKVEMAMLREALDRLRKGRGTVFTISGDAGTGKSRLIEEFKRTLDLKKIQWREGHAYPYTQNIPYSPLINLLSRAFKIEEGDPPQTVKRKVEVGIELLIGKEENVIPFIGSLYSLKYPEIEEVAPDFWRLRLTEATRKILAGLIRRGPTIICIEDLHWADPSSVDLLRTLLTDLTYACVFLCAYRPPFRLFSDYEIRSLKQDYREMELRDLSPSETQDMIESLLKTSNIPAELKSFVSERAEGNPFYLEELINSLVESGSLTPHDRGWTLTKPMDDLSIPSTIQGVISARIDRLENKVKRILQEASVIGRAFLYELLKRITEFKEEVDTHITSLERLDLVRARSLYPNLEYIFKHALTQEVVYEGLLKKERREIHRSIGVVIEEVFRDRLSEFYEALAFHFSHGESLHKAVYYFMKSGEKGLNKYALEEAHKSFREAYRLLSTKTARSKPEDDLLIDVILKWSIAFYYRGDFAELIGLLMTHKDLVESTGDKTRLGMYYASLGFALRCREEFNESYQVLKKALEIGEGIPSAQVIGYACSQLGWTCAELGLLDEAVHFGERARGICGQVESDYFLFCISLFGLAQAYWYRGESKKAMEVGRALLEFGKRNSHIRSMVCGHWSMGHSHFIRGDFPAAIECYKQAVEISVDPYYSQVPRTLLGYTYVSNRQFDKAEEVLNEVQRFSEKFGAEIIGTAAHGLMGMVLTGKGHLSSGVERLEDVRKAFFEKNRRCLYAASENTLGRVYFEIAHGTGPKDPWMIARNLGFLAKTAPFASRKAEGCFTRAAEAAKNVGANSILAQSYLNLGLLHKAKDQKEKARRFLDEAITLFEQCEADVYLKQARETLASLG